jgi:site-specific recombinase XerD
MSVSYAAVQPKTTKWRTAIARLEGAYSENTLRSYRADFTAFETWCRKEKKRALPASPETVAKFIAHEAPKYLPSTLRRRGAGIRKIHRLMRLPNPVEDEEVLLAMRRALRNKPRRAKQAYGLTRKLRDQLIAACPKTLLGLRNRAVIAVGYDTLCRRSELVGLRVEDLSKLKAGAMSILVRRAKNDPFGDGRLGYLTPKTVRLLKQWLKASDIREGWLFRRIYDNRIIGSKHFNPYTITRIIKELAEAAKLDKSLVAQLSGHSMRVGAAQDMMTSGIGLLPVMQAGGWMHGFVGLSDRLCSQPDLRLPRLCYACWIEHSHNHNFHCKGICGLRPISSDTPDQQ